MGPTAKPEHLFSNIYSIAYSHGFINVQVFINTTTGIPTAQTSDDNYITVLNNLFYHVVILYVYISPAKKCLSEARQKMVTNKYRAYIYSEACRIHCVINIKSQATEILHT